MIFFFEWMLWRRPLNQAWLHRRLSRA